MHKWALGRVEKVKWASFFSLVNVITKLRKNYYGGSGGRGQFHLFLPFFLYQGFLSSR